MTSVLACQLLLNTAAYLPPQISAAAAETGAVAAADYGESTEQPGDSAWAADASIVQLAYDAAEIESEAAPVAVAAAPGGIKTAHSQSYSLAEASYSTYSNVTEYSIFGELDHLQELADAEGNIYAVYDLKDRVLLIPQNPEQEPVSIAKEGFTFGAATIDAENNLYIVWGYSIPDTRIDDSMDEENLVFSKYSLAGELIAECGVAVANTRAQFPFDAGNASLQINGNTLACMFNTEWLADDNGVHHQGSVYVTLDADTMQRTGNVKTNEGSHSFGVILRPTDYGFVAVQRGDCYPRGLFMTTYGADSTKSYAKEVIYHSSGDYFNQAGSHPNATYTHLGGVAQSSQTYAVAGKSERFYTSGNYADYVEANPNCGANIYDVFVRLISQTKNDTLTTVSGEDRIDEETQTLADSNVIWLTACNETEKAGQVKIVTLADGTYCVLWENL